MSTADPTHASGRISRRMALARDTKRGTARWSVQPHTQQYLPEQTRSICRNSSDAKVQSGEAQETQSCVSTDWECHRPCQAKRKQASTASVTQATAQAAKTRSSRPQLSQTPLCEICR